MSALTRWRFGRKRRLVMAVTCVPLSPCFLALPLRQMMLPFIGPLPVSSQNPAITMLFLVLGREKLAVQSVAASSIYRAHLITTTNNCGKRNAAYSYPRVIHRSEESPQELLPAASVNNSAPENSWIAS